MGASEWPAPPVRACADAVGREGVEPGASLACVESSSVEGAGYGNGPGAQLINVASLRLGRPAVRRTSVLRARTTTHQFHSHLAAGWAMSMTVYEWILLGN